VIVIPKGVGGYCGKPHRQVECDLRQLKVKIVLKNREYDQQSGLADLSNRLRYFYNMNHAKKLSKNLKALAKLRS